MAASRTLADLTECTLSPLIFFPAEPINLQGK
jgi:hypothetical protein